MSGAAASPVGRQVAAPGEEHCKSDPHADRREAERDMPAIGLAEQATDDRRDERAEIDTGEIELEPRVAAAVARRVEIADLRGKVAAQAAGADDQQRQGKEEADIEAHGEVSGGHQQRAERYRPPPPEHPIADRAADDRHEVDQADIQAEDLACQRGDGQRPGEALNRCAEGGKAGNPLDMSGSKSCPTM